MPTGYTEVIKDGIDFKNFAMRCARAFGACVTLRDEPMGGDIIPEEFQPSNYHLHKIEELKKLLMELDSMSLEEAKIQNDLEWKESEAYRLNKLEETKVLKLLYNSMLAQVNRWVPPSQDHVKLKEFMIQQLEESIDFDCNIDYYNKPAVNLTPHQWLYNRRNQALEDLKYHTNEHAEELKRVAKRNLWIRQLRESL